MSDRLIALLTIIGSVIAAALTGAGAEAFKNWYQRHKDEVSARDGRDRQLADVSVMASDKLWRRIDQLESLVRTLGEELETVRERRRTDLERLQNEALDRQDEYYRKHREIERRCEVLEEANQDLTDERDRCNQQVENLKLALANLEKRLEDEGRR